MALPCAASPPDQNDADRMNDPLFAYGSSSSSLSFPLSLHCTLYFFSHPALPFPPSVPCPAPSLSSSLAGWPSLGGRATRDDGCLGARDSRGGGGAQRGGMGDVRRKGGAGRARDRPDA
ncbi:unnamed protein product [Calypogeia fissa]